MDLGLHPVDYDLPAGPRGLAGDLAAISRLAEAAGVRTIALMDHFLQLERAEGGAMLEGYTTLGFIAAHTSSVDLQLLVTGVTYRHPAIVAKTVTTLDLLSGGRAALGIGAAWYEREHLAFGVPFPPVAQRFERLEEALQIITATWGADDGPYRGRHYELTQTISAPEPLRRPPIMVGGDGERKTLRLVARYADAANVFAPGGPSGAEVVAHKWAVLQEHCEREGTDYHRIAKTVFYLGDVRPDRDGAQEFLADMQRLSSLGVSQVFVPMGPGGDPYRFVEWLGESVIPELTPL